MKKLLLLALALSMVLGMVACAAPVTMVDIKSKDGVSMKLPSDLATQDNATYSNVKTGDSASFGSAPADATPLTSVSQDDIFAANLSNYTDAKVESFDNSTQIDGKDAIVCKYTFKSKGGNAVAGTLIYITDGTNIHVINLAYSGDNANGSMAKNMQAAIDSIKVDAAN